MGKIRIHREAVPSASSENGNRLYTNATLPETTVEEQRVQRRLAAILAADVAGYSRLIGADEEDTIARLRSLRQELIDPTTAAHHGRIVKTTGDGILIEFQSVVDAVRCAVEVQRGVASRNHDVLADRRIEFRVGIHLGDVVVDGDDLFGDGVNIASRLEGIAGQGAICMSRQAFEQVEGKLDLECRNLGPRTLKNIVKPVEVYTVEPPGRTEALSAHQVVSYCRAPDGVRIAYAKVGQGPPLVKTGTWLTHLEYEWESPIWRHLLRRLASNHTLIRYDARGNGLSDWEVDELSLDAWVSDIEAVVDATGVKRFPLLGMSQGCAVSIAYALRHPERVSHLILYGGFAAGLNRRSQKAQEQLAAMATLARTGWGRDNPTFRQIFTSLFVPGATKEQADWFNEMERRSASPECAYRYIRATGEFDIRPLLAGVAAPTLVMHVRDDLVVPMKAGREMAAGIPGARFVALEGRNHLFLEQESAAKRFFEEIELFLGEHQAE
jgi:class 3 adenylate cyclase/pimeloyl-ACP methyl ester carboxylesterase